MEDGLTLGKIDADTGERFQSLRRALGVTAFGMNLMVLQPGERGRIHRHERQEEVYLVLEGTFTIMTGPGEEHTLGPGDVARVGPDVRRQVANRHRQRCVAVALGGAGTHEGRDGVAYEAWEADEGRPPREVPLPDDLSAKELLGP